MKINFTKMHGCGNDYIYFDCTKTQIPDEEAAAIKLSDRHFGIGGDGIIIIKKGKKADFEMVMYNADGSRGAMCGNGIRCVAKYVYDHHLTDKKQFTVESMGAVKNLIIKDEKDGVTLVNVDMGNPILEAKKIPVKSDKGTDEQGRVISQPIVVCGREYKMTCVSMGNPHAVVFLNVPPKEFAVTEIGPFFEHHSAFPDRINTEFAYVQDRKNIFMRVWERGSGETLACGTGACATVVAAILNGLVDAKEKITVHLVGGDLEIEWSGNTDDCVYMTGPAVTVFEGEVDL